MFSRAWGNKAHVPVEPVPVVAQPIAYKAIDPSNWVDHSAEVTMVKHPDGTLEVTNYSEKTVSVKFEQSDTPASQPSVIVEEKFIDIDTHEVVAETKWFDFSKVKSIHADKEVIDEAQVNYIINSQPLEDIGRPVTIDDLKAVSWEPDLSGSHSVPANEIYDTIVDDVATTLRGLGKATGEDAYTYGIDRLIKAKKGLDDKVPDDWIVGHIFGGSYDLWIKEYNESDRMFYGYASFGGLLDMNAEWWDVSLDEIIEIKIPPIGFKLERDFYFTPCTLEDLMDRENGSMEQAIQLGADVDKAMVRHVEWGIEIDIDVTNPEVRKMVASVVDNPEALDEVEDDENTYTVKKVWDNQIETTMCFIYEFKGDAWYYAEQDPREHHEEYAADDLPDIYFNTKAERDSFIEKHNAWMRSILKPEAQDDPSHYWYPISIPLLTVGKDVDASSFDTDGFRFAWEPQYIVHGARRVCPGYETGYTIDHAKEYIKDYFKDDLMLNATELKAKHAPWCACRWQPFLNKPGIGLDSNIDAKGITIKVRWFQYAPDFEQKFTWKQIVEITHSQAVSLFNTAEENAKHPRVAEIADEVEASGAPFNKAEETAKKTPDISWFYKPGYRKYEVAPRSSDRKDRLIGNMIQEHGDNLTSLYQGYSGKGWLSEAVYERCADFHEYSEIKREFEMWEFYTPDSIAEDMVKLLQIPVSSNVIDFTAGMGRFFNFIPKERRLYSLDENYDSAKVVWKLFPEIFTGTRDVFNMNLYSHHNVMQYSIWNPPFNLTRRFMWHHPLATQTDQESGGNGLLLSQDAYIFNTWNYLVDGGIAFFIVPDTWLTWLRHTKTREFVTEKFFQIADLKLDPKAFMEYGVEFPTKALLLMKKAEGLEFNLDTFVGSFADINSFLVSPQYELYLKLKYKADHSVAQAALTQLKNKSAEDDRRFYVKDKVLKAIYDTFKGKPMATEWELNELQDPTKSEDYKESVRNLERRKTELAMFETNVWSYQFDEMMRKQALRLNKAIARPDRPKVNELQYKIARYDIVLKRSNNAVTEFFNRDENKFLYNDKLRWVEHKFSKNDLCTDDDTYEFFKATLQHTLNNKFIIELKDEKREITTVVQKGLLAYVDRIRRLYKLNTLDTALLAETYPIEYEENLEMLSEIEYKDWEIKLLPHQKEDLAGILLKRNALISWDTGLGKTLGGITWSQVKGGRTLVIAPAVNTIDPWYQQIQEYIPDASVMLLKKASDLHKYKGQDYLIVSFESLPKIYKQLAILRFRNLILDESDNAKNKTSKRFKSLRAIAKRFKNRLLMSGTPTRNNVVEIYNQLELLAQNSNAMMCWAHEIVEYDRSTREYIKANNPHFGKPFPAWGWHKAFENTFSPKKLTCFGAAETNQDIFNKDIFDELIRSIRFTRIFDVEKPRINEVLKMKDVWEYKEYKQVMVPMNKTESKIYDYILTDLAAQMEEYYRAIHDGQTASMLVIMQQIMKLMQGTSHPWTFRWYYDDAGKWHEIYDLEKNTSTKIERAVEIIKETFKKPGNNKVMMASPWRDTDEQMAIRFEEEGFTTFRITSEMTKHKRAQLVSQFRAWPGNAIICGTMGCLKSGLNLPEVNTVIAESYPWNFAQLHQYAARAVRLNSTEKTDIYCLTSEWSFDVNVFSLILRKEVANTFVRTSEETSMAELSKWFGVDDLNLFDQAMQMVKEKTNGRTRGTIKWWVPAKMENSNSSENVVTITYEDKANFMALAEDNS